MSLRKFYAMLTILCLSAMVLTLSDATAAEGEITE